MRFVFYSVLCDNLPCARPHASASLHAFSFQQARRLVEWCVGRRVGKFWGCFSTFFPLFALPRTPICGRKYSDIETNNSPSSCIITYKITQKNPFRNKNSTLFKTFSYALKNNILHTSKHPPVPTTSHSPNPLPPPHYYSPAQKYIKKRKWHKVSVHGLKLLLRLCCFCKKIGDVGKMQYLYTRFL